ncbi:hypothetical protein [Vibrio maritimus]|uniref:hypothetical protein n=1 Tax=Vibrio maritimus TaxID=990268 RepID=UPI001F415F62|nr:hypothetical protein [Vibrio maritimus]
MLIVLGCAVAFWCWCIHRGSLYTRAFMYQNFVNEEEHQKGRELTLQECEEINRQVQWTWKNQPESKSFWIQQAQAYKRGGASQLEVIKFSRLRGFTS